MSAALRHTLGLHHPQLCYKQAMSEPAQPGRTVCLAVLPFENLSASDARAEPDYFSRGFVEDLITDLSRFPELDVMAAHSAGQLTRRSAAGEEHAPASDAPDYLLEGSVRRTGQLLRLSTRLVTPEGRIVWAERFDRPLDEVFAMQDEISAQVVASLSLRIHASELSIARRKPVTELEAYDAWLRGLDQLREGSLSADEKARELFAAALERDPDYARAHLGLSMSYFNEWSCQLWTRWDDNEKNAYEHARRASELDPDDHYARVVLGRVLLFRREFERAEQQFERALALNQNDADSLIQLSMAFGYLGQPERALKLYGRALKLNPYHEPWYRAYGMIPAFALDDWEMVLSCGRSTAIDTMVDLPAYLSVALDQTGQTEAAQEHLAIFVEQFRQKISKGREPERGEALRWVLHVNPYKESRNRDRLADGLHAAGLKGAQEPAPIAAEVNRQAFRKVGSLWQVSFAGRDAHLPDLKGFYDIARLLGHAGEEIHCSELMGAEALEGPDAADDAIDEQAIRAYRARISELQEGLEEAQAHNDVGRAETLREELDGLVDHLGKSLGLGGRPRKLGALAERARSAVTWRIRSALKKLEPAHPELATHLRDALQTGTFCSYRPKETKPLSNNWLL